MSTPNDERDKFADDFRTIQDAAVALREVLDFKADSRFTPEIAERILAMDLKGYDKAEQHALNVAAETLGQLETTGGDFDETERDDISKAMCVLESIAGEETAARGIDEVAERDSSHVGPVKDECADGCPRGCWHDKNPKKFPERAAWYEAKMGNDHQGLIVEEGTGRSVAVSYDKADAPLIAAAPEMLAALKELSSLVWTHGLLIDATPATKAAYRAAIDAAQKAEGK